MNRRVIKESLAGLPTGSQIMAIFPGTGKIFGTLSFERNSVRDHKDRTYTVEEFHIQTGEGEEAKFINLQFADEVYPVPQDN